MKNLKNIFAVLFLTLFAVLAHAGATRTVPADAIKSTDGTKTMTVVNGTPLTAVVSANITDGTIVNADINNAAAIVYSKLSLGNSILSSDIADGTIVNADISASAAIAWSKISATGSVANADLAGSIAWSKIATGNNYRLIATGGAGVTAEVAAITASRVLVSDANGIPIAADTTTYPSLTEFSYGKGVTSAIQTQLDAKVAKSTATTKGDLFVATASATIARQGIGTDAQVLTADSAQTNGLKWADIPSAPSYAPPAISNCTFTVSVAASAATIALKDTSGADPSAGSPCKISFDNGDGTYTQRSVTAALSLTITSAATLGHGNAAEAPVYIYAADNSGTVSLAVSSVLKDIKPQNVTAMSSSATDSGLYGTSLTSKPIALIGVWMSTQTTAGTWAATTGDKLVGIPRNWVPYWYQEVSFSSTQATAAADTWRDVEASPTYITLPPGTYEVGYSVFGLISRVSSSGTMNGTVGIYSSGNTLLGNSISAQSAYVDATYLASGITFARTIVATITTSTQYKMRSRLSVANTIATLQVLGTSWTGGLTDPDSQSIFFARRIR